jgi:hypothetical protein
MKLRLAVAIFYALAAITSVVFSGRSLARSEEVVPPRSQIRRVTIQLDRTGRRGLVSFDHKKHEAEINPDPTFPHKAQPGVSCIGCHHTVTDVSDATQFQKCSSCHRGEGHPANPTDSEGYDLNSREIYHRLCISCHRAKNVVASNERFVNVSFTKCYECHERGVEPGPLIARAAQPPAYEPVAEPAPARLTEVFPTPIDPPLGFAGPQSARKEQTSPDFMPRPDRWRIGWPQPHDAWVVGLPPKPRYERGRWYDPYHQNVLKGDYPIIGQNTFLVVTAESDTIISGRRLPVPSDVSSQRPDSSEFFGRGGQLFFRQNFVLSVELFQGGPSFKPIDRRIRITPNFNINYLLTRENGIVNIDPRRGKSRLDGHVTLEEAFGDVLLGDTTKLFPFLRGRGSQRGESPYYDITTLRMGIQPFVSDFRGFIFRDSNLGIRLFGNHASNRYQFNAAYFYMLEKDTNSELNSFEFRDQTVYVVNFFRQDTKWLGYTTQFSFHYNNDRPSRHFDKNNFLVRPANVGDVAPHGIKAAYIGWAGEGHMGRLNISHALYQVLGHDTRNPIAGRRIDLNAQMAAVELSVDRDWLRFKGSFFWASGDKRPLDGTGRGFDAILDFPEFAGGPFSFWNSEGIRLTQTGVALVNPGSLLPSLRSSKTEGQANFVNPGIFIYNLGLDADLTPKLKGVLNLNYLHFHHTEPLELLLFQPGIRRQIGFDYGLGVIYRPLLNENIILTGGFSSLVPGSGFREIYSSNCTIPNCGARTKTLYSAFLRVKFAY